MRVFLFAFLLLAAAVGSRAGDGNRLAVLDDPANLYYPNQNYPKLTTPQWIGEEGVDAALILAIDDMREIKKWEDFIRPILERLKQVDGNDGMAPLSIMTCKIDPAESQLQKWLAEGVSIEVHTIDHPCPILAKGNFDAAKSTYDRCVDLISSIPNNYPVAFRTPCMDGINSASPRLFAEILNRTTTNGNFLTIGSSVGMLLTPDDPENPRESVTDANGQPRFNKYLLPGFINYYKNYPYPYVVGNLFWETGFVLPDDYEGSRPNGDKSQQTVDDMLAAIDAVVAKRGIWVLTFHPYNWIANTQVVQLVDKTVAKHGRRVKFLNFREAQERIDRNLLAGQPLRRKDGSDNGVRLLDLNNDGYLDVVIGNESMKRTRVWDPKGARWIDGDFPVEITSGSRNGDAINEGVHFAILQSNGYPSVLVSNEKKSGLWNFDGVKWVAVESGVAGLHLETEKVFSARNGKDNGVRFRDLDGDGVTELILSNPKQNAVFAWNAQKKSWKQLPFGLPKGAEIVNAAGRDNGVRFLDFNQDGAEDVIFSNEKEYGLALYVPKDFLGFKQGYSREVLRGRRGEKPEIPMITRGGAHPDNGAWFAFDAMWVQNEDTDKLTNLVEKVSFKDLLDGLQPQAKSPADSLSAIEVAPNLKIELVAHEPAIQDPVYLDWGADGRMWVVEMRDYPRGDGEGMGVIKCLEDQDGDGFYEKSTVFLDHVNFPNGLIPWRKGVLISAAPDIIYAEDTDGDGRADHTEVLFTGFREGNPQHRANGYELGLDGWVYGANGDSGGDILSKKTGKRVSISGSDFRFKPDTGEFEAISGNAQFGRRHDDWGNWFGGANYTWGWNYYLDEHYLARNPHLAVNNTRQPYATAPGSGRVFAISRVQQRFNDVAMLGQVTSACSFMPYRDDLFDGDFQHSIFISEPSHNLIHREVLEPDGIAFKSHRSPSEENREFVASRDPWFRPTTIKTGPDGAIYFCDMYRLVIEHPEWIPQDVQDRMDLRAGDKLGRIYRVRPKNKPLRKIPNLSKLQGAELAQALESSNGWQRDTVERLLLERNDKGALPALKKLAHDSANPKVRLQALYCIDLLGGLTPEILAQALNDSHPAVRGHAIRLSEHALHSSESLSRHSPNLFEQVLAKASDPDLRVQYQLAFTLGESNDPRVPEALARLGVKNADQDAFTTAVLSSSSTRADKVLADVLDQNPEHAARLIAELFRTLARAGEHKAVQTLAAKLLQGNDIPAWKLEAVGGLLNARVSGLKLDSPEWRPLFRTARAVAKNNSADESERATAVQLLGRVPADLSNDIHTLTELLTPDQPLPIQQAALRRTEQIDNPSVARELLKAWPHAGAQTRAGIAALLLRRESWTEALLDQVAAGALTAADLGPTVQQQLKHHRSAAIRSRASQLFAAASSARDAVVQEYVEKTRALKGDAAHGRTLFEANCAVCHKAGNLGTGAGPNLAMLYDRGPEQILTAILDPNRAVEDKYRNYVAELKNGEEVSGLLANETRNSITIVGINGVEQPIVRGELRRLEVQNRSLMPEGFEQFLKAQDFADLIAFIQNTTAQPRN